MTSLTRLHSTVVVADPVVPYMEVIPDGLYPGRSIVIRGAVLYDPHQKRFVVEFCCGLLIQGDHQDDKALHFNPRFDTGSSWFGPPPDRQIVLNSLIGNRWGMEERYANVFKEGNEFSLRILVLANYFSIAVDGRHLCDYLHRISITNIRTMYIGGNVRVNTIEYKGIDDASTSKQINLTDEVGKLSSSNVIRKPKVPFVMRLKERLSPGTKVLVTGTPLMNAECFTINFLTPMEHFFHFRVNFSIGNEKNYYLFLKQEAIVRNSTEFGKWQKEEREMCSFPFRQGITFDIMFYFEEQHISITINGSHFANFHYRKFSKLIHIEIITVKGDLSLQKIEFR
uniref:Galectin n=1 Tax=Wuchereria bancrofti TaxID=6293 RepID=A0A1I8ENL8_WUCBA